MQLLQSITGTPWAPNPAKQKEPREALELPEPVSIEPEQPEEEVRQVETSELKPHFRRVYLRQDDFDKFGYSAGCKACALIRSGLDRQGVNHAEDCRLRIVQRLQETEYGRRRIEPSSGSGIKRPAEDPPQDPRFEDPEQPGGSIASTRQPGTKRDVEQAGFNSDPMEDVETSLTNVLLFLKDKVFLEHFALKFQVTVQLYLFAKRTLGLTQKNHSTGTTFRESRWTPQRCRRHVEKNAK